MQYMYNDKTEYLLSFYEHSITFKKERVESQLKSVRKRNQELKNDLYIYLTFFWIPPIVFLVSFFIAFSGSLILNIIFVPTMFLSAAAFFIFGPFSAYKFFIHFLMFLLNRHNGNINLFGNSSFIYTYRTEENYCMGKIQLFDRYLATIDEWRQDYEAGKEIPDPEYISHYLGRLDLDFTIKVATVSDPILKRLGKYSVFIMYVTIFFLTMFIWSLDFYSASQALDHFAEYVFR